MSQDSTCSAGSLCSALVLCSQGPVTSCLSEGQTPSPTVGSPESPTRPRPASGPKSLGCWPPAPRGPAWDGPVGVPSSGNGRPQ